MGTCTHALITFLFVSSSLEWSRSFRATQEDGLYRDPDCDGIASCRLPNDGRRGSGSQLRLPRIITFIIVIESLPSGIGLRSWLLAWAPPCIHTGTDMQNWNHLEERTFALQYVSYPKYFLVCLFVYQKDMLVVTLNLLTASSRDKNKSLQAYLKLIGLQLRSRRNIKSDSVISPGAL